MTATWLARGYALVDLLVAVAIVLTAGGATLALLPSLEGLASAASASADVNQRIRTGVEVLAGDLSRAGSGLLVGGLDGGLPAWIPVVLPDEVPLAAAPRAVAPRDSTLGLFHVPPTAAQARLALATSGPGDPLTLEPPTFCVDGLAACGFATGTTLLVADRHGGWDHVTVSSVDEVAGRLWHVGSALSRDYDTGAIVTVVESRSYTLRPDPSTGASTLFRNEGTGAAQPVLDHVVSFEVRLFGDGQAPVTRTPDPEAPSRYGPPPPAIDAAPLTAWPAGENCVYTRDTEGTPLTRLPALGSMTGLTALPHDVLADGPWCPDEAAALRYDADLYRVRLVTILLRVQVASTELRGPAGVLFGGGGTGRARVLVPDREVRFSVGPRSLGVGR